jgi:hypothetical protein
MAGGGRGQVIVHPDSDLFCSPQVNLTMPAAALVTAPSARAHGGVSIGIGFGFPAFIGAPVYAPPVYYVPPPVYYSVPYVGYYGPPPLYRRHYHRVRHYRHCCCCY